ncbi:MAG: hypothetical protein Q9161_000945 [Pseudevernia consocians]
MPSLISGGSTLLECHPIIPGLEKVTLQVTLQPARPAFIISAAHLNPDNQPIHVHGHVLRGAHPFDQSMLFYQIELLHPREVFGFELAASQPLVVLIGSGSDVARLDAGDRPLGLSP